MKDNFVFIDWETFSEEPIKSGAARYAEDPTTRIQLAAWARGWKGEVKQWDAESGEPMPNELEDILLDERIRKQAWNASFEQAIDHYVLGNPWRPEQWYCDMVHAFTLSLPGSLDKVGEIIGISPDKAKLADGKKLVRRFCQPQPASQNVRIWTPENDPENWERYKHYNKQDVEAERAIAWRLRKWPMPKHEWRNWVIDQRINQRGMPIDVPLVKTAVRLRDEQAKRLKAAAKELTGLDNPNSDAQMMPWAQDRGYCFDSLNKDAVRRSFQVHDLTELCQQVLTLRAEWKKTSTQKYSALLRSINSDNRLRNAFQFAGAQRTWRWAGRIFQPQNLPSRGIYDDIEALNKMIREDPDAIELFWDDVTLALVTLIRSSVRAPDGQKLVVSDLNAIENRVLGWVTGEDKILKVFRDGLCPYKDFGTRMFKKPYKDITKQDRTNSKPAVLGAGYMLGGGIEFEDDFGNKGHTGLWGYAESMGIEMDEALAHRSVEIFRSEYTKVVEFWWEIDRAFREVVKNDVTVPVGKWLKIDRSGPFVRIHLPSGRCLYYLRPKMKMQKTPWGAMRETITYEGINQMTKQWTRISTHPGKLTENVVQAIARDLLMNGINVAERNGLEVVLHVHDEIVALVPEDNADGSLLLLNQCLSDSPSWAPGLPLGAEGFTTQFYMKD